MGLFSSSKKKNNTKEIDWIAIESIEELAAAIEQTKEKPALFFKHSTRCSISKMMLNRFEKDWEKTDKIKLYYIDLLAHREVSNQLAEISGVTHESPQVIVIKNQKEIYNHSHNGISVSDVQSLM